GSACARHLVAALAEAAATDPQRDLQSNVEDALEDQSTTRDRCLLSCGSLTLAPASPRLSARADRPRITHACRAQLATYGACASCTCTRRSLRGRRVRAPRYPAQAILPLRPFRRPQGCPRRA